MIKPLTSLRFFAAFLVYLWHIHLLKQYQTGYLGVSFFFVLSGFILTYTYIQKFKTLDRYKIKDFYVARIAKIYPVHLLTFLIALPYTIIIHTGNDLTLVPIAGVNLLLLQSFTPFTFSFNGVSWSISAELFFYLSFPFVAFYFLKKFASANLRIIGTMVALWIVSFIVIGMYQADLDDRIVYSLPLVRVLDFVIGMLLGLVFIKNKDKIQNNSHVYKRKWFSLFEVASIIMLIAAVYYSPNITQSLKFSVYYLPFWSVLIYIFAFQKGVISKVLSNTILVKLGEISFSFYMIHQLVLVYFGYFKLPYAQYTGLFVSIILSTVVYYFYEERLRKLIRNKYKSYSEGKELMNLRLKKNIG